MRPNKKVVLWVGMSHGAHRDILRGFGKYCRIHGPWALYTNPPFYLKPRQHGFSYSQMRHWSIDGIFVGTLDERNTAEVLKLGIPTIVSAGVQNTILGRYRIVPDDRAIGRMAAEHLLERKLKNFGYCGFNGVYWSNDRGMAFADALAEAGHKTDHYRQPQKSKLPTWENELPHIVAWLTSLPKPVGIMACCDDLGQHVIEACNVGRLRVPHEVAVIAVDNDELLCEMTFPPLSSITVNFEKVGFEAASLLDKLMSARVKSPKTILMEPTGVVTRQSTDMLAIEDKTVLRAMQLIRERMREPIRVADIARELALSNRTLDRKFRTFLGRSAHSEIVRVRIEKACQLLLDTNMAISNIASHLGYSELGHMTRAFKNVFGTSPLAYRKKYTAAALKR